MTILLGGWKRATLPTSLLAGGRRATKQNLRCSLLRHIGLLEADEDKIRMKFS